MKENGTENFSLIPSADVHEQKFQFMLDNLKIFNGYEVNKFTACYTRPLLQNAKTVALCVPFQIKSQMEHMARRNLPISKPVPKKPIIKEIKLQPTHLPTQSDVINQGDETSATTQPTDPDEFIKRNPLKRLTQREIKGIRCPPSDPSYWSNGNSSKQNDLRLKTEESNSRGSLRKASALSLNMKLHSESVSDRPQISSQVPSHQIRRQFRKVTFKETGIGARESTLSHEKVEEKQEESEQNGFLSERQNVPASRQNRRSVTANPVHHQNSILLKTFDNRNNSISPYSKLDFAHAFPEKSRYFSEDSDKSSAYSTLESKTITTSRPTTQEDSAGNIKEREKFIREFIDENFGGSTSQGHYIRTMSNQESMIRYAKAHNIKPNQIIKNLERLLTDDSPPSSYRGRFSYMDVALENANGEVEKPKTLSRKQRAKQRAAKRKESREKFGIISSLVSDYTELKKDAKDGNLATESRTSKIRSGDQSPLKFLERPVKSKTRGQIALEVQRRVDKAYNKLIDESSARLYRGQKITPSRLEIQLPIRTQQK